jgi:hypothetical protein
LPVVRLNINSPYNRQREVLDELFAPTGYVKKIDLCCGRGFGKTVLAILAAVKALSIDGEQVGLFLEPDRDSIDQIFLPNWEEIVPAELYHHNSTQKKITWINGSVLYYGLRNVTGSVSQRRNKYRGRNLNWVIDDEAAIACDRLQYSNTLGAIRRKGDVRFYFTISTPQLGEYRQLITSKGHTLFRGTSADNPYLPEDYISTLTEDMSADQIRREVYGEFISLEGRIWKEADMQNSWPNGTMNDEWDSFREGQPWWLLCDLGSATGAYVVVQQMPPMFRGQRIYDKPVWVAVADFCPVSDASAGRAFSLLKEHYGTPIGVTAGADVETRAITDGSTVSYFVQQAFGNVPIYPCNESVFNKQIQGDVFSGLIKRGKDGARRFTVARNFNQLDPDSRRGVLQVLEEDEYPEQGKGQFDQPFPKGNQFPLCHARDALLMGFSQLSPPSWSYGNGPA